MCAWDCLGLEIQGQNIIHVCKMQILYRLFHSSIVSEYLPQVKNLLYTYLLRTVYRDMRVGCKVHKLTMVQYYGRIWPNVVYFVP